MNPNQTTLEADAMENAGGIFEEHTNTLFILNIKKAVKMTALRRIKHKTRLSF
jgi:hypothetical protein